MDLLELLEELGIEYKLQGEHRHATSGWASVDCPMCSPNSGSFRLGISLAYGNSNCWACGPQSTAKVLAELSNLPLGRVISLLKETQIRLRPPLGELRPRGKLVLPKGLGPLLPVHKAYLRERGLDPEVMTRLWGLQGIGMGNLRLAWRIFIPIIYHGKVVSFTTRSLGDQGLRYITAKPEEEALPAKSLLFGGDYVRNTAIVVEGPFSAMRIGPGAVATLGAGYSQAQLARLAKIPVRVVCLDSDLVGQRRARELVDALAPFPGVTHNVRLESAKAPDDADPEEIMELRRRFLA